MKLLKLIILATITISMSTTVILTVNNSDHPPLPAPPTSWPVASRHPTSRFLQQKEKNHRATDHCKRDSEICRHMSTETNTSMTCCNNKCINLTYNDGNCGACKRKCEFTETCCRGECVNLAYDKRHCGYCNNRCMPGGYCIYGMCDYA